MQLVEETNKAPSIRVPFTDENAREVNTWIYEVLSPYKKPSHETREWVHYLNKVTNYLYVKVILLCIARDY